MIRVLMKMKFYICTNALRYFAILCIAEIVEQECDD
jgi:hypothetical protein